MELRNTRALNRLRQLLQHNVRWAARTTGAHQTPHADARYCRNNPWVLGQVDLTEAAVGQH